MPLNPRLVVVVVRPFQREPKFPHRFTPMPIEQNVQHIDDLNPQNPPATDPLGQVYNHLNMIKTAVKQSFPNVTGAVTATHTVLNGLDGRVTAVEGRDIPAIKDNSGTPELVTGITAAEIRNLINLGTSDSPTFSTTSTAVVDFTNSDGTHSVTVLHKDAKIYSSSDSSAIHPIFMANNKDVLIWHKDTNSLDYFENAFAF